MSELFKHLKRKTAKAAIVHAEMLTYEEANPQFAKPIKTLVSNAYEVGLEIEVELVHESRVTDYIVWIEKEDNSLRPQHNSAEFVSVPMAGDRIHFALNQFYDKLEKGYRFSPRTSIHVHLNVLGLTLPQIATLTAAHCLVEPLLYKFVGEERDKSNFCVPWYEADAYGYISYFLDEIINFDLSNYRYLGLNIDSIRKFGTLEFRHLGGTDDKLKIVNWLNLIFRLKKYALNTPWAEFKYKVDRLNTDSSYSVILSDIFGDDKLLLDTRNLAKDLEKPAASLKKLKLINPLMSQLQRGLSPQKHFWFVRLLETPKKEKKNEFFFERPMAIPVRAGQIRPRAAAPQQRDLRGIPVDPHPEGERVQIQFGDLAAQAVPEPDNALLDRAMRYLEEDADWRLPNDVGGFR